MFSANLKLLREKRSLSQAKLSKQIGCSATSIHKWEMESSTPSLLHAMKVSEIFSVGLDEIAKTDLSKTEI